MIAKNIYNYTNEDKEKTAATTAAAAADNKNTTNKKDNSGFWGNLFNNIGGMLSGAGDLAKGIKGTQDVNNIYTNGNPDKDKNTTVFVVVGVLAVILFIFLAFKK